MKHGELIAGRYELAETLGRGAMGEVWTARDSKLRRDVAVKLLALDDAVTPDGRPRPAGWNDSEYPAGRADGSIPLCVLGPLTAEQHADLVEALTRHAGPRWRPEVGYLDDTI